MKKIIIVLFMICSMVLAQESFESYNKMENAKIQNYNLNYEKEYNRYLVEEKKAYNNFIKEVEKIWGKGDVKLSTKTIWVDYDKTKAERSVVDFKDNKASIEIIVDKKEANDKNAIQKELIDRVDNLVKNKGKTRDYDIQNEKQKDLLDKPILKGQLELKSGEKVTPENSKEFAKETIKDIEIKKEKISKDQIKISITFPLAPSSIRERAEMFAPTVQHYSKIYKLKPELVMAIIHTESCFNPKAQSHVPAYGLMQLVPRSGGLDASRFVYKQNLLLTSNVLVIFIAFPAR
jgi:membrane-bound lytic murein transglycosylase C